MAWVTIVIVYEKSEGKKPTVFLVASVYELTPSKVDPLIANLRARPKTKLGNIIEEVCELLDIRAPAPIDQDAILSESSDTEESENALEESDLDSE
ncbi:hypothetical protein AVEN_38492-1 [Araneus ventricosus]|uniref:Uncharacterized protein n=1 Tax=Araneus ventricosus TaxID=182803 RepID=A0A4Y2JD35_ARAVE|nr:hypothetical protein AVEN_38492-1 [Araneus ventricosus]